MALTPEQVAHVAALARLELSPDEAALYRAQLSAVLDAASLLDEVDVSGVQPTRGDAPVPPLRPDVERPSLSPEQVLGNAPAKVGTTFSVPKILE
ncbi:MAG: Asp-tRNA(Asn)/Glu-tRNA(Gln) amidotransferase subunit GatC [Deltaproteobacteria bacterium]|nr:Asp-tRNA(Asn)/Glu-tRNA(Gln) amidotransferase subunit GatC [Deltaproteobacteria bacterium]